MALSYSVDKVDENGREMLTYGTPEFPIAFFDDDLTKVLVPWHWHDELEIVIITNGTVNVKIANSEFMLSAGEGYFSGSGILHSATLETKTGHQHALVFSPRVVSGADDLIWNTYVAPILNEKNLPFIKLSPSVPWQKEILKLSDSAWEQGAYEKIDYPITVRQNMTQVFSIIFKHLEILSHEYTYTDRFQKDEFRIKKALIYIENNYQGNITIDDIAASSDISVSTCLRLFKNVLGTTTIRHLVNYRLQKAIEEMTSPTKKPIGEIAFSCGFADATYFNRCFKKEYGMTPTQYMSGIKKSREESFQAY